MSCYFNLPGPACAIAVLFWAVPANAYDASWYKTDFWAGEYPNGFTLKENVTTQIRDKPDPAAPRAIGCALEKGATYHPWNGERVEASRLQFASFVRKVIYVIKEPATIVLQNEKTEGDVKIAFQPGDKWTWLTYYAEGTFRMEYRGSEYAAEQDLFAASEDKGDREHEEDEWLRLTCANGAEGWLLLEDVADLPEFEKPDFPEYGKAPDRR